MQSVDLKKTICCYLFFLMLFSSPSQAQLIQLPREWKFKIGDDIHWAEELFNDAEWNNKAVGNSWSAKDIKDNVFAWYRTKIIIPSSMKSAAEKGKGIKLNLGKIDDVDQTFFNGKLVGQTGSLPPKYESKWDAQRIYFIPENVITWDKENVIAVRVFSLDNGGIGMYEGPYHFGPVGWTDFISVQHTISETGNNGFTTTLSFTNKSSNGFNVSVKYSIADKNNKELFTEVKPVQIQPAKDAQPVVTFSNYQPTTENIFKVSYLISETNSSATIKNEQVYLTNKKIEIKVSSEAKPVIENKVPDVFTSIPFQDQQLQGYLGNRLKQNLEERLLKVDEQGIINGYLQRPGNHPWIGEHVGKYLETACNTWKNTHDTALKKQMDRMMYELINSQLEDGYLGTYTPDKYWTSWDVWSHKYNLYGLLAYYAATGYQPALEACKKIGDLLSKTFGNKPGQLTIVLAGEHVGMAATSVLDPMVELYRYTGEKKYLDFCYYIIDAWEQNNGPKIISSLLSTGKVNKVANGKAYEMLSNLVGLIKLYRVTGNEKFLTPVLIAWNDIVSKRLYVTGTTSSLEYFQDDEVLPAAAKDNMGEGCVTVTWIQLNQGLLAITGDLKYVEQIEKSIYNHLLGAENPQTGCVSYYTPLTDKKPYSCDITCCTSSVPRGIAMIPYFTFGNVKNIPTLMLYELALYKENLITTDKKNIALSVKVVSNFPENGVAVITINTSQKASFPISFRVPSWCHSFIAKLGDKEYKGTTNQYVTIQREWVSGEEIKVSFDMPIQIIQGGKSYPGQIAFQRGPQILALDNSLNTKSGNGSTGDTEKNLLAEKPESNTNTAALPEQWIGKQSYTIHLIDKNNNLAKHQLIMVPFADAGQTGGKVEVWMNFKMADQ
jgi:DUF1680 family protein